MATVEGLGTCPVCTMNVDIGQPAQYFAGGGHGNVMAHTACVAKRQAEVNTPEYKRQLAENKVANAQAGVAAAIARLDAATAELEAFGD